MSRETTFKAGAWVGGYEYKDHEALMEDIKQAENDLAQCTAQLMALVCVTPSDVTPVGEDPLVYMQSSFDDWWADAQVAIYRLGTLYTVENNEEYVDNA